MLTSLPLPSCRSRSPAKGSGLGNVACGTLKNHASKSQFVNLKETLDKALREEIDNLIKQNSDREN